MNSIISRKDEAVVYSEQKLLAGYILAGYPSSDDFFSILRVCEDSPLDILEIGFPSAKPYADGPVIAQAHGKVDRDMACNIDYWKRIRNMARKPIWLMAYDGDFIANGLYRLFIDYSLVDALVIPDMATNDRESLLMELKPYGVDVIGFVNPGMPMEEMDTVFSQFSLVYEQLYVGQTGVSQNKEVYHPMLRRSLEYPQVIGFAGFGINSYDRVLKIYQEGFHGAIIGTEIIKQMNISQNALCAFLNDVGRAKQEWQ